MPGEALELRGVSFSYGDSPLFEGLDLAFEPGCVTGVVGPNGCGKSTLLKLAGGLLAPSAGEVVVLGRRLRDLKATDRARLVALLPQETPAVPMSVRDLVLSGRYANLGLLQVPKAADREASEHAISLAGVAAMADRPVRELSGGQRQRAYLAMLLAQQAPVMLLDEPTSALDIGAAHDTLSLVRELRSRREATVAAVMHDLDLALRYCDRVVVMEAGRVVAHDAASRIACAGALERVFRIELHGHDTPSGRAFTFHRAGQPGTSPPKPSGIQTTR